MGNVICQQCRKNFEITPDDENMLEMLHVPAPTFCPECRAIRRLTFRNERSLFKRQCDSCKQESIMMYAPETAFPVYCRPCWWSDSWNPKSYGREYDFNRPFFEQFKELFDTVPRPAVISQGNIINSEYTNRVLDMRNCYLVFGSSVTENSRYSVWINYSKECQDCYATIKSERCFECIDSTNCYNLAYSRECTNCRDSWLLYNCQNVSNSFGCVNLRNKQYCIFNEQYTKEEYEKKIAAMNLKSSRAFEALRLQFEELKKNFIVPALVTRRSVMSTGNWIEDSKNAVNVFNGQNLENVRHGFSVYGAKDSMDYSQWGNASELIYEAINTGTQCADLHFAHECWNSMEASEYVMNCHTSKNLFGCIGLRNSQYCILNKEYSKEEYESMVKKIKAQMDEMPFVDGRGRTYRYGEFYPIEFSPFGYNETLAQEFYPISKAEAEKEKFPWRDAGPRTYKITLPAVNIPDSVDDATDNILKEIIGCAHAGDCQDQCTTAFRIIPEELEMHRRAGLPFPKLCPNCRHYARIKVRNPLKLWSRACQCPGAKNHQHGEIPCELTFETSYAPDRPEKVYCIECYQQEVA